MYRLFGGSKQRGDASSAQGAPEPALGGVDSPRRRAAGNAAAGTAAASDSAAAAHTAAGGTPAAAQPRLRQARNPSLIDVDEVVDALCGADPTPRMLLPILANVRSQGMWDLVQSRYNERTDDELTHFLVRELDTVEGIEGCMGVLALNGVTWDGAPAGAVGGGGGGLSGTTTQRTPRSSRRGAASPPAVPNLVVPQRSKDALLAAALRQLFGDIHCLRAGPGSVSIVQGNEVVLTAPKTPEDADRLRLYARERRTVRSEVRCLEAEAQQAQDETAGCLKAQVALLNANADRAVQEIRRQQRSTLVDLQVHHEAQAEALEAVALQARSRVRQLSRNIASAEVAATCGQSDWAAGALALLPRDGEGVSAQALHMELADIMRRQLCVEGLQAVEEPGTSLDAAGLGTPATPAQPAVADTPTRGGRGGGLGTPPASPCTVQSRAARLEQRTHASPAPTMRTPRAHRAAPAVRTPWDTASSHPNVVLSDGGNTAQAAVTSCSRRHVLYGPAVPPDAVTVYWELRVNGSPGDSCVGVACGGAPVAGKRIGTCAVHLAPSKARHASQSSGRLGDFSSGDRLGLRLHLHRAAQNGAASVRLQCVRFLQNSKRPQRGVATFTMTPSFEGGLDWTAFRLYAVLTSPDVSLTMVPDAVPVAL